MRYAVIIPEFIRVNEAASFHLFNRHIKEILSSDFLYNLNPDLSPALQDTEHRDLPGCSPATVSFLSPSKIRFIHLNLPERVNEVSASEPAIDWQKRSNRSFTGLYERSGCRAASRTDVSSSKSLIDINTR